MYTCIWFYYSCYDISQGEQMGVPASHSSHLKRQSQFSLQGLLPCGGRRYLWGLFSQRKMWSPENIYSNVGMRCKCSAQSDEPSTVDGKLWKRVRDLSGSWINYGPSSQKSTYHPLTDYSLSLSHSLSLTHTVFAFTLRGFLDLGY